MYRQGRMEQWAMPRGPNWDMTFKRHQSGKLISGSDINAFAHVMALVIFAVLACCMTTMGYHHSGGAIDLPKVLHPVSEGGLTWGVNRHDAIIISVSRSGDIFMQNDRVPSSALAAKIHQRLSDGAEAKIYIRADARARYSSVKSILDDVQSAGVKEVSFLADKRRLAP
jgi:biopolymer transport protein ExbD